jgi:integrase
VTTDFAVFLHRFLTSHLAGLRGCSPNTIASYRDTYKLLIAFFSDGRSIPPDKLTLDHIDAAAITGFLHWLEAERHNSISTRNQRLAAISSFYRWLQSQDPARMAGCQDILAVPAKKKARPGVNHLTAEQTRRLLAQPERSTRRGRRDATLLATLYDTAARVQELADLTVRDIRLQPPALAVLTGVGWAARRGPAFTSSEPGPFPCGLPPNPACPLSRHRALQRLCRMRDRVRVDPVMARRADHQRLAPHLRHEHGPRGLAWSRRAQLLEAGDLVNCHRGAFVAQLADPRPEPQEKFPAGETDRDQAGVGNYRPPVLPQSDPAEACYQIPLAPARHPRFKTAPQAVAGDDLRPVTGGHLGDGRVVLGGQGFEH